ncbi:hypothetical protein [Halorientalis persicus]|nr:hypothetical protein [Halorientalis persicus]
MNNSPAVVFASTIWPVSELATNTASGMLSMSMLSDSSDGK